MSQTKSQSNAARETVQDGPLLEQPYNVGHPDYFCPNRSGRSKHKFYQVRKEQVRTGVFRCLQKCEHCGAQHSYLSDYTVLCISRFDSEEGESHHYIHWPRDRLRWFKDQPSKP